MAQNQGIPQIAYPFVDETGNITQPWFQLLISLWQRTGGGSSPGFISEIDTGEGLTGGPINAANPVGTISLDSIESGNVLANITSALAIPAPTTLSNWLDFVLGSNVGEMLYRGSFGWLALAIGTNAQVLTVTSGVPTWTAVQQLELLPLANGDIPGVTLIGDTVGQPIGVPLG